MSIGSHIFSRQFRIVELRPPPAVSTSSPSNKLHFAGLRRRDEMQSFGTSYRGALAYQIVRKTPLIILNPFLAHMSLGNSAVLTSVANRGVRPQLQHSSVPQKRGIYLSSVSLNFLRLSAPIAKSRVLRVIFPLNEPFSWEILRKFKGLPPCLAGKICSSDRRSRGSMYNTIMAAAPTVKLTIHTLDIRNNKYR